MIERRNLLGGFLGGLLAGGALAGTGLTMPLVLTSPAEAKDPLALTGYDPVSYFSGKSPKRGRPDFTASYRGLTYRFQSATNRKAFQANPARYAPQYDGFCAYGVSRGYKVGVDPLAYRIVNDRLYVNFSKSVLNTWSRDIPGYIAKAERNWPGLN